MSEKIEKQAEKSPKQAPEIEKNTAVSSKNPQKSPQISRFPFQITPTGLAFFGILVFIFIATVNSGTNLLYFSFGIMIGAAFVSVLFSHLSLRNLRFHRNFGEHMVAGEPADILYTISNPKRFWPTMSLSFHEISDDIATTPEAFVLYIPRKGSVSLSLRLIPRRRGILKLSKIRISSPFPFGFIARNKTAISPQELIIYPRIGVLNRRLALQYRESIETGTMTSNVRGGTDEFYGLREYRPGDNIRSIHWRSSARNQQLMIKEMAANAPPQMIVILNLRSATPADAAPGGPVEKAIELAASLLCYGFFENFAVGLAIAGAAPKTHIPPSPQMGRDARARLLKRLAILELSDIDPAVGITFPNRLAGRAEWIIITLKSDDPTHDLVLPSAAGSRRAAVGGALNSSHHTTLAVDAPDADTWLHFLTPEDTLRLLRDRSAGETAV